MKQVYKRFGEPESAEMKALREVLATPGYAQSVTEQHYVNAAGERVGFYESNAVAEEFTLTTAGSVLHDTILGGI